MTTIEYFEIKREDLEELNLSTESIGRWAVRKDGKLRNIFSSELAAKTMADFLDGDFMRETYVQP